MSAAATGPAFGTTARPAVEALEASLIRVVAQQGMGLPDVIPLWFGEPDAQTPDFVRQAAKDALDAGRTFYVSNYGIEPLRAAISTYATGLGRGCAPERVCVTSSGVNALMLAAQAILQPGDRVVLPTPHWPNLGAIPAVAGAVVHTVPLELRDGLWRLDLDRLLAALTPDTRMVILNAPANPTGWMLEADEQRVILAHCRRLGIWVLADDVYERVVFDRIAAPVFGAIAAPEDRLISVNSFSKSWAMTGWRLGWITAPPALMPALGKLIEYDTSCAPEFVQRGAMVALERGEPFLRDLIGSMRQRRDLAVSLLRAIPGLSVPDPAGAMYVFARVDGCGDSLALALRLLREARVGVAPGRAFGVEGEGCIRLCFAVAEARLREAGARLAAFFATA